MKKCLFCAEEIQDTAIVCKHCGRDVGTRPTEPATTPAAASELTRPMKAREVAGILILGSILAGGYFISQGSCDAGPGSIGHTVVTMAEFNSLRDGMSYSEAVRIIGEPGTEISRSSLAGTTTVMYSWQNASGSNMNAMFQNDKMITKAQFGLP